MERDSYVDAVERKGWNIYDISRAQPNAPPPWKDMAKTGPAQYVQSGGLYILTPRPKRNQSLAAASTSTGGFGPCLKIADPLSEEYTRLSLTFSPSFIMFTKMAVQATGVHLFFDPIMGGAKGEGALLSPKTAEATFARDFDIITETIFTQIIAYERRSCIPLSYE